MFDHHLAKGSLLVSFALLGACGGGGNMAINSTPTPTPASTPTPTPTPTPALTPSGPLLAAVQTGSPSPQASGTSPSFSTLGQVTPFPLLISAINGTFGGDSTTTQAGASLAADPNGPYQLTVNDPRAGITNVPTAAYPGIESGGLFKIVTQLKADNLDYTRYGDWFRYQLTEGVFNAGAFTGGYITPIVQIPAQGSATFTGKATGLYNDAGACNCGDQFISSFIGNANLTADFGTLAVNGSITNITLQSLIGLTPGPINNIGFSAALDRPSNLFSGTTSVTSQPGGTWAFGPGAAGLINGRFYGPGAKEAGAVFTLTDGLKRLIGSLGVGR